MREEKMDQSQEHFQEKTHRFSFYCIFIKQSLDFIISLVSLVFLMMPFLIIAICIKIDSSGPILFKQQRMGKDNHPFYIYKFRSMYQDAPHQTATADLEDAERHITRVGKFLRKASLDELPQLLNVLKGDMSIIGPRPLILSETTVLTLRNQNEANHIKPGITGLAQVNGRDEISDTLKAKYDGEYARTISFRNDFMILCRTVLDVLHSRGIKEGKQ